MKHHTESVKFFTAPPLVAIICYFTRKQAGDQVLACDWAMRVWCDWVQPIRFIWLNPSVHPSFCSPACLFSSPSIHQPATGLLSIHVHCRFFCQSFWLYVRLSFYHLVSCAFVGLAVRLSTYLSILKAGMHNREAEMTVHLSPPENNNEDFY